MKTVTQEKIKEVTDKIVKEFEPEKIILFGSYAWGKPTKDSDVDLFIIKNSDNTRETTRIINRFIFPRPFPLDLIVYTSEQVEKRKQMHDFFLESILTRGRILYER